MTARVWMDQGTKMFLNVVDSLHDAEVGAPSALPGWTRAHVIAHLHFNAQALLRLLHWAKTGRETPMYAGPKRRAEEIESGAALPPDRLRELVHASADNLTAAIDALPKPAWNTEVVTAQGRRVPTTEIVWMRTRELAVHAVDLDHGVGFIDLPDDLNTALAADVVTWRCGRGEAAALACWLTGRTPEPPQLNPWL